MFMLYIQCTDIIYMTLLHYSITKHISPCILTQSSQKLYEGYTIITILTSQNRKQR